MPYQARALLTQKPVSQHLQLDSHKYSGRGNNRVHVHHLPGRTPGQGIVEHGLDALPKGAFTRNAHFAESDFHLLPPHVNGKQ